MLLLAAWWSWPRTARAADGPPLRIALVDVSRSVRATRPDWPAWLATELARQREQARARGEVFTCLSFARDAELVLAPGAELTDTQLVARLPQLDAALGASELAAALDLAQRLVAQRESAGGTLALLGGASFTGPDPSARLAAFADAGFAFEHRAPPAGLAERALGELELPRRVRAGERVRVRVPVYANAEVELHVRARWDGGESGFVVRAPAPPGAALDADGLRSWWSAFELGPCGDPVRGAGRVVLDVVARPPNAVEGACAADERAGANVRSAEFVCGAQPLVVVAGDDAERARALATVLAAPDTLRVETASARDLAARLELADALVTCDVAPAELPARELAAFVRGGGGWCALAGERTAAAFDARERAPALALLPLVPLREPRAPREIVFLVDGSGSMAGETQLALAPALGRVLALLGPQDTAEFRWFAGTLGPPRRWTGSGDAAAAESFARALVAEYPPGGPTRLLASFAEWLAARDTSAPDALVFVFGDGRESERAGAVARARELAQRARAARVRCACVAVGPDVDAELLGALLGEGRTLERARELETPAARARLARFLEHELARARRTAEGTHVVRAADGAQLDAESAAILAAQRALATEPWPPIASFLGARAAEHAAVLWETAEHAPLLAAHSVGLGRTAACAFAPGDTARAWDESGAWRVLAPLAAWLATAHTEAAHATALALRAEDGELVLTGRAGALPARVRARVEFWPDVEQASEFDALATRAASASADVEFELAADSVRAAEAESPSARAAAEWRAPWPVALDRELGAGRVAVTLGQDAVRALGQDSPPALGQAPPPALGQAPPRTLVTRAPRAPEDRLPRSFWRAPDDAGAPRVLPRGTPGPDPRGVPALAAALVLLGLGGVLGLSGALRSRPRA